MKPAGISIQQISYRKTVQSCMRPGVEEAVGKCGFWRLFSIFIVLLVATVIASPAQTLTTLHNFTGPDGNGPAGSLILARDGNYYGTTDQGGTANAGVIFKMTPTGTVSVFYNFCSRPQCTDGVGPYAALLQASDGNLYGTTLNGGTSIDSNGTVFKITPSGTLTTLHSFCTLTGCADGSGPFSPVIQGRDGNLYGTTYSGGTTGWGTLFKITLGGTFSVVYTFDAAHGEAPNGVIQGSDGNFYLTAYQGGTNNAGTVVKVTPNGSATVLYNFCSQTSCTDGNLPFSALLQGPDGLFYGTTARGGTLNDGTVFTITSSGTLTILHSFDINDGYFPSAAVIQAADGNFYGTTFGGGANNLGTIFGITASGSFSLLHSFAGSDGSRPQTSLLQKADGSFYGTTNVGGTNNFGTVFQLALQLVSTTTVLTSAPNPSYQGENVTMTATVTAQNGSTPSGTVVFNSNGAQIGSAQLDNSGVAVLNFANLAAGSDSLTAVYQGSPTLASSTSNTVAQVVHPDGIVAVTSTPNPSTAGQSVTITATVGPSGPPQPTGTVSFTSNGNAIAGCTSVTLSNLTAVCVTSGLPTGTDVVVATYSGDNNYGPASGMITQIVNPVRSALQFVPVTPCRIVDTRNPNGPFGGPPIPARTARSFPLTEGDNPCGIPASAVAYSLNVTVVPQTTLSFLTIWPTGEGQPTVSTLNAPDGRTKANAAIVPAGMPSGGVSVYVTQTTNVIIDINGYFKPADASTLEFYPVAPCRVADTRSADGPLGGPPLMGTVERDFPVLSSACNLPSTAVAYSLNFTAVPLSGHLGFLTVWPQGQPRPTVSTLNDPTGTTVANAAIVPAGTGGGIATYASQDTNLIIDVNGYFAPPGTGGLSLYVLTPCRVLDTRNGNGAFSGELTVHVMSSFCEVSGTAQAYVFNATVLPVAHLGFLTLWPDGESQPTVSTLNAPDGAITSNMAIVPTNNGSIDAYASQATQLILDISSYFAP
jgi:uncharacterized repeat protein (TIGR03803 family)